MFFQWRFVFTDRLSIAHLSKLRCLSYIVYRIPDTCEVVSIIRFHYLYRSVADKLKAGSHIDPELFLEASVYFSDIVSFTKLAGESSPMQVVTMLNDLYRMFDTTIAKFNVYKVCYWDIVNENITKCVRPICTNRSCGQSRLPTPFNIRMVHTNSWYKSVLR